MSSSKITLIGFYKFMDTAGNSLFKYLDVPEGIDKEVLINTILLRGGEFEVIYSDPDFLQLAIANWSKTWERTFKKWVEALSIEYNPLENYDRNESFNDVSIGHDSSTGTGTGTSKVSAYNSKEYEPDTQSESSNTNTATTNMNNTRTGRIHGNVGVTTSQQMLEAELNIASWNLYAHISDVFLKEFVIPLY